MINSKILQGDWSIVLLILVIFNCVFIQPAPVFKRTAVNSERMTHESQSAH